MDEQVSMTRGRNKWTTRALMKGLLALGEAKVAKIVRNLRIMGEWRLFELEIWKGNNG